MIALDTNVLIYACDRSNPERQRIALEIIERVTDGVLLWQVACEFVAASRKLSGQGFDAASAWSRLSAPPRSSKGRPRLTARRRT